MIEPLRTINKKYIYPATPTFIKTYFSNDYNKFINMRTEALTPTNKIWDTRLRDYQNEDVDILTRRTSNGIFNQQRLGKTPETLVALKYQNPGGTVIIVSPKSVHYNWYQETIKWYTDSVCCIKGTPSHRKNLYNQNYKVYIMSYETASIDYLLLKPTTLILDEAHRINNFKGTNSKQSPIFTKHIMYLSYNSIYKYALTGTPTSNYAWDIFAILHFLYPNIFRFYWNFINYYFSIEEIYVKQKNDTISKPIEFKSPEKEKELREFLETISIQRKRKDHMKWLPKIDKKTIKIPMEKKQKIWYNELQKTFECKELNYDCPNSLALFTRSRMITTIYGNKIDFILNFIKDYPEQQIIIASTFTQFIKDLHNKIPNSKIMIGATPAEERKQLETNFNNRLFPILIGNIAVLKEGLKLENGNTIIIANPSLNYGDNEQLEDRFIPTTEEIAKQKDINQIIYLITENSIDEYVDNCLAKKMNSVSIINNYKNYKGTN